MSDEPWSSPRARDQARAQRHSGPIQIQPPKPVDSPFPVTRPQQAMRTTRPPRSASPLTRPLPLVAAGLAVLIVLVGVVVGIDRLKSNGGGVAGPVSSTTSALTPVPTATATPTATVSASAAAKTPKPSASPAPGTAAGGSGGAASNVKLGVFIGTSTSAVRSFGNWLGRSPDYAVDFPTRGDWNDIANPSYMINQWAGSKYRMVYSIPLLPASASGTMKAGSQGDYDKYFKELAQHLVAGGQGDAILRLGWEFNLGTSHYSTSDRDIFIAYWRHVVKAMRSVPGQNLKFDWNVNVGETTYDATNYYPGGAYVDYVGVDVYDVSWTPDTYPYPSGCSSACRVDRQQVVWDRLSNGPRGLNYWSAFARSKGKKMSLPEWGMWTRPDGHGGGDDAYFVTQMFKFIDNPNNHVAYQAYLEADSSDGEHELTTLTKAGKIYRNLFGK